jgi:hypothetical protein
VAERYNDGMEENKKPVVRKYQPIPYNDPASLTKLFNQPKKKIAESIVSFMAGAASMGRADAILASGRVAQAAIRGNLFEQLGNEIESLIKKGKMPEDYAERKYGFQSLSELLNFIDSEAPDAERFRAVKALFYALNSAKVDGEEVLRYQLFKLSMRLTSSQLLTLRATYRLRSRGYKESSADGWRIAVANEAGHHSMGLVMNDEVTLERERLIGGTTYQDGSGIKNGADARLTDLGIRLIENIEAYEDLAD